MHASSREGGAQCFSKLEQQADVIPSFFANTKVDREVRQQLYRDDLTCNMEPQL